MKGSNNSAVALAICQLCQLLGNYHVEYNPLRLNNMHWNLELVNVDSRYSKNGEIAT